MTPTRSYLCRCGRVHQTYAAYKECCQGRNAFNLALSLNHKKETRRA